MSVGGSILTGPSKLLNISQNTTFMGLGQAILGMSSAFTTLFFLTQTMDLTYVPFTETCWNQKQARRFAIALFGSCLAIGNLCGAISRSHLDFRRACDSFAILLLLSTAIFFTIKKIKGESTLSLRKV